MTPWVSLAVVYERNMSDRSPACSLTRVVPSSKFDKSERSKTFDVDIGIYAPVSLETSLAIIVFTHVLALN
jgi:hypothetical protein